MKLYTLGSYAFSVVKQGDLSIALGTQDSLAHVAGADGGFLARQGNLPLDPLSITQTVNLSAASASAAATLYDNLMKALRGGRQLLTVVMPDSSYRQQYAQLGAAGLSRPVGLGTKLIRVQFTLQLSSPWWEANSLTTVTETSIDSSPTDITVTNGGTLTNKGVRVEVENACEDPAIENLTTGESWAYTGTLEAADVLVVDGRQGLVTLNDGDAYASLTLGNTQVAFLTLATGANTLRFTATSPSGVEVRVKYRNWYL